MRAIERGKIFSFELLISVFNAWLKGNLFFFTNIQRIPT